MQLSRALRLCFVSFTLTTLLSQSSAVPCASDEGLTGIGDPISLEGKLSIFGFSASVSYVTLPAGSSPFLTILSASEEPAVTLEDGLLTISTSSCDPTLSPTGLPTGSPTGSPAESPTDTDSPTASPTESPTSAAPLMMTGLISTVFAPKGVGSVFLATSLMGFLITGANAAGHISVCTPSLEIEISIPAEATVTEKFGDTDHYLAATVETVTWGYYDPEATPVISMESGETITVEVITHHSGHDYAKMILGDPAVEEIFYWANGTSASDKAEPKLPGSGVHLVTGPIEVVGAEVGDIIQVDILELDPRYNPVTGRCFGTNSQKFAGYQYNSLIGYKRDGTQYVRTGGTEAITVFEFLETDGGDMIWGEPVYMYRYPNMTAPDGSIRTFDNNPAVIIPHEFNYGYEGELLEPDAIMYPEGFDGFKVTDEGGIVYLSPEEAALAWKVPLRPHLGTLAVMPNNTANYIDDAAPGGASTIPPSRFGGNIDDWRIGKGGTMYYKVEVPGALIVVGDTHAAQGDSELAGTAMETSMTTKLRVTLHKADSLPKIVATLDFPLLEVDDKFVVHGFAYENYLDELEDPSDIFSVGTSLDLAMADCFNNTRAWLMDVYDLIEEETIALMTTSVDFGITQVVDGNWGVHADIPKWVFDDTGAPYDYTCTTSKSAGRRLKTEKERRRILEAHGVDDIQGYADELYGRVTAGCDACADSIHAQHVGRVLLDAKLVFAKKRMDAAEMQARRHLFEK